MTHGGDVLTGEFKDGELHGPVETKKGFAMYDHGKPVREIQCEVISLNFPDEKKCSRRESNASASTSATDLRQTR